MSALHDLGRALKLTRFFSVPSCVVINKVDLCSDTVAAIEELCEEVNVPIIGRIPFDRAVVDAMAEGVPPVKIESKVKEEIVKIYEEIKTLKKGVSNATR
jgi:MinD superfamily P-loop ATPase